MADNKVDTDSVWDHEAYIDECVNIKAQQQRFQHP